MRQTNKRHRKKESEKMREVKDTLGIKYEKYTSIYNLDDAKELVKLLKGMLCHVNLIPINKIDNGKFSKSTNENIMKFRDYLNSHGIVATIRRELGSDIDAACGQLRKKEVKKC